MMIKALKSIYDIEEGNVYDVVFLYKKESKALVIDDRGDVMMLVNGLKSGDEFEVVEE